LTPALEHHYHHDHHIIIIIMIIMIIIKSLLGTNWHDNRLSVVSKMLLHKVNQWSCSTACEVTSMLGNVLESVHNVIKNFTCFKTFLAFSRCSGSSPASSITIDIASWNAHNAKQLLCCNHWRNTSGVNAENEDSRGDRAAAWAIASSNINISIIINISININIHVSINMNVNINIHI